MVFCYCPTGKFEMTNPPADQGSHRVELTQCFWITKYCVNSKQWRDFGKYDCEGVILEVEGALQKYPIYPMFNRWQWDKFCEYLTARYVDSLPKGYVFRLPTEAEWEYAFVADQPGGLPALSGEAFHYAANRHKDVFDRLLTKNKKLRSLGDWCVDGLFIGDVRPVGRNVYVGGRVQPNRWGVCDMWMGACGTQHVLDAIEYHGGSESKWDRWRNGSHYYAKEVDPIRWDGDIANFCLLRRHAQREMAGFAFGRSAHIVIGPDVLAPLKKKESEPYPEEDFGGRRISDKCTIGGFSSLANGWKDAERHKKLLTPEPLEKNVDTRAFHTERETAPWVQIDFPDKVQIAGLVIEARGDARGNGWNRSAHLVVWISDDMKTWREAARNEQNLHRYRFDLSKKMVNGKYLRIGRDSKTDRTDWFHLNKVLIYGR